ncbi:MAG TPA: MOSC domain-containing protein [Candidatus Limnocylindrales bacterium]
MISVSRLSIAPVRSLGLSHPASVELGERGVLEDRRFFVTDLDNRLVDQLIAGRLVQVHAATDPDGRRLSLALPDGRVIDGEVELGEAIETPIHGRTGVGHVVQGPWAEALEPYAEAPVRIVRCDWPGGTRRGNHVSLVSLGSVRRLGRALGVTDLDPRRFRMLIEVDGAEPHEEDRWVGWQVAIGSAVLGITKPDKRCAMTTHDPDSGRRDIDTLRGIISYRGLTEDRKALFGVLGEVAVPGRIAVGDEVRLLAEPVDEALVLAAAAAPASL